MLEKLLHAGRFSPNPTYSLFSSDSTGYTLLFGPSADVLDTVNAFKTAATMPHLFSGLEIRCNGIRVAI